MFSVRLSALLLICLGSAHQLIGSSQNASSGSPRSPQIAELSRKLRSGDKRALALFWSKLQKEGAPLIETIPADSDHHLVTFVWRAASPVENVLLISGLTNESH